MIRITETTDGKYRGHVIDETAEQLVFDDGCVMNILIRRSTREDEMLSNFNYIIRGIKL
jgi:hypothetical protein